MQPSWRNPKSVEASADSWLHLLCGGPNGHLLVVLALAWWMRYSSETHLLQIQKAVMNVTWVLGELGLALDAGNKGKKRELEIEASDDLPLPKRYFNSIAEN